MNNRVVRIVLILIGVIALGGGTVWVGQGSGLIPGSVMTGDRTWFYIGLIVGLVGVILAVLGLRRPRRNRSRE